MPGGQSETIFGQAGNIGLNRKQPSHEAISERIRFRCGCYEKGPQVTKVQLVMFPVGISMILSTAPSGEIRTMQLPP